MLMRGFRRIVWLLKPTTPSAGAGAAAQVPTQRLSLGMTILAFSEVTRPEHGTSHHGRAPAVDIDSRAGDVAALVRHQKAGEIGEFLGLAEAADRDLLGVRAVI